MLRRTGFRSKYQLPVKQRDREPAPSTLRSICRGTYTNDSALVAVEKENPLVCEAYRRLVRAMPCKHCGRPPQSEFAHSDESKGMGIKSDDRTGWPGCKDRIGERGCHYLIGTARIFPKAERRELEARYARETRAAVIASGKWPKSLPLWSEKNA